jgi:uncharacterized membrane protein YgcG
MRQPVTLAFAVVLVLSAATLRAAAPSIDDRGGLFSPSAVDEGNRIVDEIHRQTRPPKNVAVVTLSELPPGVTSAKELAEQTFRERSVNGLLVFAVKNPGRLEVVVGRRTEARFAAADRDELVRVMLDRFKRKKFDDGLLEGLRFAKTKLVAAFPTGEDRSLGAASSSHELESPSRRGGGIPPWAWVLIIGAGVWILLTVARAARQPYDSSAPSAGGYPPSSGYGGFGRSLLGGLFGAMAGEWIYDRLSGRGEPMAYDRRDDVLGDRSDLNDDGDVGSSGGGDWGDSSDSGGGDFGGGDDSGGGDF